MDFRIDDNVMVYPGNFPEHILPRDPISQFWRAVQPVDMKTFETVIRYQVKRGKEVLFCLCRELAGYPVQYRISPAATGHLSSRSPGTVRYRLLKR